MTPWSFSSASVSLGGQGRPLTLVDGTTFVVATRGADLLPGGADGLYMLDTRVLSELVVLVDGRPVEPLATTLLGPFAATCVGRGLPEPGRADAPLVVLRRIAVGRGLREEVEIRNHTPAARRATVRLEAQTDFAGLFDVKGGRPVPAPASIRQADGKSLRLLDGRRLWTTLLSFDPSPTRFEESHPVWEIDIPAGGSWRVCILAALRVGEETLEPSHPCGTPLDLILPARRLSTWREAAPDVTSDDPTVETAVRQAVEDLGALRIVDPRHAGREVIAAGAPWFMTLFGRDSLITSWMSLLVDPRLAVGTLRTLAERQGTRRDPVTDEQPGRILHEVRFSREATRLLGGASAYYGSVDATPLFVMLLGELARWGVDPAVIADLLPAADRALDWTSADGDLDGDGYVEHLPLSESGLVHQGWKDSWDGTRYADGRVAVPPVALAEVQAYVYAAHVARADLASLFGDEDGARRHRAIAAELKERFNRDFWLAEKGWYAVGLDADKRPIDSLASNMGHALWSGIVDPAHAPAVAARLVSSRLASGWGLRTLDAENDAFNPLSYHCGSVWPHDTAIAVAGLARYGFREESNVLARALLDASADFGGRLPELFGGFERLEVEMPVPYPTSCSPQAWAAAAPLLLVRTMLGLEPDIPRGEIRLAPRLPAGVGHLTVSGIPLGDSRIDIEVVGRRVGVEGVPAGIRVILG